MEAKRRGELGDVEIVVMCRSNHNDIDVTVKTLRDVGIDPNEVTFFIFTSGSDLHLKYKIGKTLLRFEGRDEADWLDLPLEFYRNANIRLQCDAIRHARDHGVERIEFGAEDGSRGDVDYFISYFKARDSRRAARVRRGRIRSARSRPRRLAGTARASCKACRKASRSSRTCTTTTVSERSTRSRRRRAGSRSSR